MSGRPLRTAAAAAIIAAAVVTSVPAAPARAAGPNYRALAEQAMAGVDRVWWNPNSHWYTMYPFQPKWGKSGLATLWDVAAVFEAAELVALADPRPATEAEAKRVAVGAERYRDPATHAYTYLPDGRAGTGNVFFDDNGWWGLAFFDAFRATHDRRFLADAIRTFRFIVTAGWAGSAGGGVWWDTAHEKVTAEPLAAAALLGAELYETTHGRWYLQQSLKLIGWADRHSWNAERALYQRSPVSDTVMNYVQGMMIGAHAVLCRSLHRRTYCRKGDQLAAASLRAFPHTYHWAPETDAIYLRWLLELWRADRNPRWYAEADYWGRQAARNARDARGLFSKRWDGGFASNDRLLTPGGTAMLFAALAAARRAGT